MCVNAVYKKIYCAVAVKFDHGHHMLPHMVLYSSHKNVYCNWKVYTKFYVLSCVQLKSTNIQVSAARRSMSNSMFYSVQFYETNERFLIQLDRQPRQQYSQVVVVLKFADNS